MSSVIISDWDGNEITTGCKVIYGSPPEHRFREAKMVLKRRYRTRKLKAQNLLACFHRRSRYIATVISISDPDGDYDDELGRGVEIPPYVTIRFKNGDEEKLKSTNDTVLTWADYPDGPGEYHYIVDDLEVIK